MMENSPLRTVVVAGDGIVAWSAAAAIRRRLPMISVMVLPTPQTPGALADRIDCTLPSILDFHKDIGLDDADVMVRAHSGVRLGTKFEGWASGSQDYVHAYGEYGTSLGLASFHQYWLRARSLGRADPFDCYSAAAQSARAGKLASAELVSKNQVGSIGYGLHIDPPLYRDMVRAYALYLGAVEQTGALADIRLRDGDGFIAALVLSDGSELLADLFIDATGPEARLRTSVGGGWEDWSGSLIADRVLTGEAEPTSAQVLDCVTAIPEGWVWKSVSPVRTSLGLVYSSRNLDDTKAANLLRGSADSIRFNESATIKQGRWTEPWTRNCVAIGDAAIAIEPLEWTNLHLAHNSIDRLIAIMPDSRFSPVELWDYNRQAVAEADRARDFLVMHYVTSCPSMGGFWTEAALAAPPPSLEHTLTQFRERGRLPFYEEETFSRDSWFAVLLGQGVIPRRVSPLVDSVPIEQVESAMRERLRAISSFVQSAPPYSHFLENLKQKAA